jgi:hypothetical protein
MTFQLTDEQLMSRPWCGNFPQSGRPHSHGTRSQQRVSGREPEKDGGAGPHGNDGSAEFGGEGADTVRYVLALAEIAYACAATAVVCPCTIPSCAKAWSIRQRRSKKRFLKMLASGTKIGAFAMTEPHAGSNPAAQSTPPFATETRIS